jgi:hypothetical protein
MYQPAYYHHRQKPVGSYFLPFVSLIIIGLIGVLVFQIVGYFQAKHLKSLENKAAVKVVTGRAEMKIWGVDQWMSAVDGSILHEGDVIRTDPGSRVILSLLNGSLVRIASETEIEITELKTKDTQDEAVITLKKGEAWFRRSKDDIVKASFKVITPNLDITSPGTIFDVENTAKQAVRVLEGKIFVAMKAGDVATDDKASQSVEVVFGQELKIGPSEILDIKNRRQFDFISVLSDEFRNSDWYVWNRSEDATNGSGISVEDAVQQKQEEEKITQLPADTEPVKEPVVVTAAEPTESAPVIIPVVPIVEEPLTVPVITAPAPESRTTKSGTVVVTGTVSPSTVKMQVTTFMGGKAEAYFLQKYKTGSVNWSYVASIEYGNFLSGENKFEIRAVGRNGEMSGPAVLNIVYDKPKEPADLSAPTVTSFNGKESSITTDDFVIVNGKIGKGIVKVFVNDFALSKYVLDSEFWSYYVKPVYGNLKEGLNQYSVYGVDIDGNKTPATNFTITKNPTPVAETPTPAAAPAPSPEPAPVGEPVL